MSETWQRVAALDLRPVKKKLASKKGFWWRWRNDLDRLEAEYRQFLYLIAANPGKTIVPWSEPLDEFWHEHILDTAKYAADCQAVFGRYVHHNPHLSVGSLAQRQAFADTKRLYREAFKDKADRRRKGAIAGTAGMAGCGAVMPVVFCGTTDTAGHRGSSAGQSHAVCGTGSGDAGGDSDGSACGSSCGSSCGSAGCGGGGGGCGGGCGGS